MKLVLGKQSYKLLNLDLDGRTNGRTDERTPSLLEAPPASQGRLKMYLYFPRLNLLFFTTIFLLVEGLIKMLL